MIHSMYLIWYVLHTDVRIPCVFPLAVRRDVDRHQDRPHSATTSVRHECTGSEVILREESGLSARSIPERREQETQYVLLYRGTEYFFNQ